VAQAKGPAAPVSFPIPVIACKPLVSCGRSKALRSQRLGVLGRAWTTPSQSSRWGQTGWGTAAAAAAIPMAARAISNAATRSRRRP